MGSAGSVEMIKEEFTKKLVKVKTTNPENLCAKHLSLEYLEALKPDQQETLYRIAKTGLENPDSSLGCYAMKPDDYETFNEFFDKVIREYHGDSTGKKTHTTDWDITNIDVGTEGDSGDSSTKGVLDVSKLGLPELSMRVRVGRNLKSFPLPGMMTKEDRINFEKTMLKAFDKLQNMEAYGGKVYSLTPDFGPNEENPNLITEDQYKSLVDAHIMFKNMDEDPYLKSAGISNDWPYGRGCYVSDDEQFIIWFGEEDQLRIMCMKKGTLLNEVFQRLQDALNTVESIDGIDFARSDSYGYVTSCPSNLGTGMRASVHIKIPNLTKDGTDKKAKQICKPLGLSVRGTGGEHTPIGEDGTVDISPSSRLFIKESEIIEKLYQGIKDLMVEEKKAAI